MTNEEIITYNERQPAPFQAICELLMKEINKALPKATSKLYHANPVWFIDNNPIVGYDITADHVNILFWSGDSFQTSGLSKRGKFKAAGTLYKKVDQVDVKQLKDWLKESKTMQWNYKDLRKNNGIVTKVGSW